VVAINISRAPNVASAIKSLDGANLIESILLRLIFQPNPHWSGLKCPLRFSEHQDYYDRPGCDAALAPRIPAHGHARDHRRTLAILANKRPAKV
jgi:hypothetical protein